MSERKPEVTEIPKPSVGRIVHFRAPATKNGGEAYAALVTRVHSPAIVDLVVFGSQGVSFHLDIPRLGHPSQTALSGSWDWPPRM